ncbi:cytochrome P450 monooxygenase [Mycena rosella]|uniref:Cytochrome P450 monooxygenase n=1 Tax=Mycena rosella TaxID=1033263 RepID=A0AAD7GM66_MYCRO|nr:cytochrome P450 monooxygenase [Mycena rosella]
MVLRDFSSPLRKMRGPKNPSLIFGNIRELENNPRVTQQWRKQFGPTFQFKGLFNTRTLYTVDLTGIDHILKHDAIYQKQSAVLPANNRLLGQGLLSVEGEDHKRQRRVMNPAFGTTQIRSLMDVFVDKSIQLRDIWVQEVRGSSTARIDVLSGLSKMTLDVIGQAGFDYKFDSLNGDGIPNEIHDMFNALLHSPNSARLRQLPLPGRKVFKDARKKLFAIGNKMLSETKAAINTSGDPKSVSGGRDLLSLLVRANMSPDVPDHHRMSDREVIGQIPTFFLAGHVTTSSAIAWALHALSANQSAQKKLREELLSLPSQTPTLEQLDSLPYLEWVVRETMRVHSPVSYVIRVAVTDDVLPLGTPYIDEDGTMHDTLLIPKGQMLRVPIVDIHTDPDIWGADAADFRPERWEHVPEAVHELPGVWANLLTFLAGPHNCIGFRFSLAEQKALLFVLIRAFEFERAVPDQDIQLSSSALQSPFVKSERKKGSQMPLIVKLYQA